MLYIGHAHTVESIGAERTPAILNTLEVLSYLSICLSTTTFERFAKPPQSFCGSKTSEYSASSLLRMQGAFLTLLRGICTGKVANKTNYERTTTSNFARNQQAALTLSFYQRLITNLEYLCEINFRRIRAVWIIRIATFCRYFFYPPHVICMYINCHKLELLVWAPVSTLALWRPRLSNWTERSEGLRSSAQQKISLWRAWRDKSPWSRPNLTKLSDNAIRSGWVVFKVLRKIRKLAGIGWPSAVPQ